MAAADAGERGNGVPVAVTVTEKKQQYNIIYFFILPLSFNKTFQVL